jgi:hypothetical protein
MNTKYMHLSTLCALLAFLMCTPACGDDAEEPNNGPTEIKVIP